MVGVHCSRVKGVGNRRFIYTYVYIYAWRVCIEYDGEKRKFSISKCVLYNCKQNVLGTHKCPLEYWKTYDIIGSRGPRYANETIEPLSRTPMWNKNLIVHAARVITTERNLTVSRNFPKDVRRKMQCRR